MTDRTRVSFELTLEPESARVIDAAHLVSVDGESRLVLFGSTVRGLLRHAARRFGTARGERCSRSAGPSSCGCLTCGLFGGPDQPGRVSVRTSLAPVLHRCDVTHVAIDRRRRTADRSGGRLASVQHARAIHTVRVEAEVDDEERLFLEQLFEWLSVTGMAVGRRRSSGSGRVTVGVRGVEARAQPDGDPQETTEGSSRQIRTLLLEATEPMLISGRHRRSFYQEAERRIPPNTLRGALGWALARNLGDDWAAWLMSEDPIRIGPGWYLGDESDDGRRGVIEPTPWFGVFRCRGPEHHVVDLAARQVVAALGDGELDMSCPRCGASLKARRPAEPPLLVVGQTEIDPVRNRAAEGRLRHRAVIAPGARFAALVEATAGQFEALGRLAGASPGSAPVTVGGHTRRGLVAVRLEIGDPVPAEPAVLDVQGPPVALIGVPSDGFPRSPIRQVLEGHGLEVITGECRPVVRGGWDGQRNRMRPVRRLVAAGSWLAVRTGGGGGGPSALTAALDAAAADLYDPSDPEPIWFVPRPQEAP